MSKKRALQLLHKRQAAVFEGRFDLRETKTSPKFSEAAHAYLENYSKVNKRPQSYRRDTVSSKNLKAFFGERRLNDIKPMLIEHYKRKRLEEGRSHATINRELALLKHLYSLAVRDRLALSNPVKDVAMFPEPVRTTVFSRDEEQRLLQELLPHVQAVVICAIETGMRQGEVFSLKWEHVDLMRDLIWVEAAKTNTGREIPISRRLKAVLLDARKQAKDGPVFRKRNGEPVVSIRTAFENARERAGLGRKHNFHALRHSFGTRQDEVGTGLFTIGELMGHSTIVTTQRYAHPGREAKRKAIARLARAGYYDGSKTDVEEI